MTRILVYRLHACPACQSDEQFQTKVSLGDYSEMHDLKPCGTCGHELTEAEQEEITESAEYSSIEDFYDQRADALAERNKG